MTGVSVDLAAGRYRVEIGAQSPDATLEALQRVTPGASGYALFADRGLVEASEMARAFIEVARARLPALAVRELPAGEANKTWLELGASLEWMAAAGLDRRAVVVGLGGGAAGDHAGLAAALYLRGVRHVLLPSTLLAMVDASVGGKTAVDLAAGKNLAGAFHQPVGVIANLRFLETLPERHLRAGLAEVVKCGLVGAPGLLERVEAKPGEPDREALVAESVSFKASVVVDDEREHGRRAILNFGHTLGHAFEADSGFALLHGEAVALGMVAALAIGKARGLTPPAVVARAVALLAALGLPVDFRPRITEGALARLGADKKRAGGAVRFVLIDRDGPRLLPVPLDEIRAISSIDIT